MSGRKGMLHYRMEIKEAAVRLVLEEHMTYAAVADKLNMRKPSRIKGWVQMYREEGELSFCKPIGRPMKTEREEREVEQLRMDAKRALLKRFHTELRGVRRCGSRSAISGDLQTLGRNEVKAICKFFDVLRAAYYE
jgi:transposase